jgi:hypothetical protein
MRHTHEMHAYEVHADEMHPREIHTRDVYALRYTPNLIRVHLMSVSHRRDLTGVRAVCGGFGDFDF